MKSKWICLWDLFIWVCYWLLVLVVIVLVVSGKIGGNLIDWYGCIGLLIVGLVVFCLVWGLFGLIYVCFFYFFFVLVRIWVYLKGEWCGVGYNLLGVFFVFGLFGVLVFQVVLGLFLNDDIVFSGLFFNLVDQSLSNCLIGLYYWLVNLLFVLVGLYVVVILFYLYGKKENLVKLMFIGWKNVEEGEFVQGGGFLVLIVVLVIVGVVMYGVSGLWIFELLLLFVIEFLSW